MYIEIDNGSGFCFGVTRAINKAEEELAKGNTLYCLGDIVHNGKECDRLKQLGLITINHHQFKGLERAKVLLRAHGEPPSTYQKAKDNHIEVIDMYISMKVLRIIYALLFSGIIIFNFYISHNENIPDNLNRKIGTISFILLIMLVMLGSCLGITNSE